MGCRESRFESSSSQSETSDSDDKPIRIEIMFGKKKKEILILLFK